MKRPSINEHDNWSYLGGSLSAHNVEMISESRVSVDGQCEPFYDETLDCQTLCEDCSFVLVRRNGFVGPVPLLVSYGPITEPEMAMLKFNEEGALVQVATYAYGRAYFEPGEERTALCDVCKKETLVSNDSWIDKPEDS